MNYLKKVYVVGPSKGYARWINNYILTDNIKEADIVFFTGGEDINPILYNKECHSTTYYNERRDYMEVKAFNSVPENAICIGTCRGLQLMTALLGGILVQNVHNHWCMHGHSIKKGNKCPKEFPNELFIPSLHHQMVYPYDMPKKHYKVLYVSAPNRSSSYEGDGITDKEIHKIQSLGEPEIVLYTVPNKPVCLGIQGHPEMIANDEDDTIKTLNTIVNNLLSNK